SVRSREATDAVGRFVSDRQFNLPTTHESADHTDPPAPWVLVVAVDVPRAAEAVPRLVAAVQREPGADGAHLVADGRAQWLVGLYRVAALTDRLSAIAVEPDARSGRGASVRRLLTGLHLLRVPDPGSLSADVDTWDDAERLGVRPGPAPKERP
ncbi:molybdenum cofactor guanylyltransferase, partial [Myceligenerans cantabricum]